MASKDKIPLSSDIYIELTTDIADWIMQERYKGNYKKYIYSKITTWENILIKMINDNCNY